MTVRIIQGDAFEELRKLPEASVHACVTSPPYWGLRDYGTAKWEGGDLDCKHAGRPKPRQDTHGATGADHGRFSNTRGNQPGKCAYSIPVREQCTCGAIRIDAQIGLESTPDEYVEKMVAVFREVRRVLRDDATIWLNLGDSYAAGGGKQVVQTKNASHGLDGMRQTTPGFAAKQLIGIPWRVAFALQADGWYLRQDIIWSKPNPMPESVRDRCTKAHEYLFLLAKSQRYYFDADAIAEQAVQAGQVLHAYGTGAKDRADVSDTNDRRTRIGPADWNQPQPDTRNKRSVWTVATQPFKEAHFATFPPALIEPCILAGCPEGGTVLDPFGGAGTTGLVADRLHRDAILIELNNEYADMSRKRIASESPLFAEISA